MDFYVVVPILQFLLILGAAAAILIFRSRYKNRSNAGAFFFENGCLVLNCGLPASIPLAEIDWVELRYSPWEVEHRLSYGLFVKVVRKNGSARRVYYKGYQTSKLPLPADMEAALRERGVSCRIVED
ncbi:MAG: hypothetical protein HFG00_04315 [Oscillibacter sp.]|nr:hypothetical protein [Oscillibacter sp.]